MKGDILTLQEVAEYLKVDEKTVYRMVQSKRFPAFKVGNQWRFLKMDVTKWIESMNIIVEIPIVGKVAAGLPLLAQEDIEGYVKVDRNVVGSPDNVIALRVQGTSMIDVNINDGDVIVVRKQPVVNDGEIAVVQVNNEATVKRIYREGSKVKLVSENPTMDPMYYDLTQDNVSVVGIFKVVVRKENISL